MNGGGLTALIDAVKRIAAALERIATVLEKQGPS